jgi:hypothetical protein
MLRRRVVHTRTQDYQREPCHLSSEGRRQLPICQVPVMVSIEDRCPKEMCEHLVLCTFGGLIRRTLPENLSSSAGANSTAPLVCVGACSGARKAWTMPEPLLFSFTVVLRCSGRFGSSSRCAVRQSAYCAFLVSDPRSDPSGSRSL